MYKATHTLWTTALWLGHGCRHDCSVNTPQNKHLDFQIQACSKSSWEGSKLTPRHLSRVKILLFYGSSPMFRKCLSTCINFSQVKREWKTEAMGPLSKYHWVGRVKQEDLALTWGDPMMIWKRKKRKKERHVIRKIRVHSQILSQGVQESSFL